MCSDMHFYATQRVASVAADIALEELDSLMRNYVTQRLCRSWTVCTTNGTPPTSRCGACAIVQSVCTDDCL